jgi:plasmid stability protein
LKVNDRAPARNGASGRQLSAARDRNRVLIPCHTESVANLTITVDDEVLKRARIRALSQGTSVNAILAERLKAYAGEIDTQAYATRSLIALAKENGREGARAGAKSRGGRRWSRDGLHEL